MKNYIYLIVLLVSVLTFSQENNGVTLTIEFPNLLNDNGKVSAGLYNEATFMKAAPLDTAEITPKNKTATLTFKNVQPGTYGIMTLHDFNKNGRMDFDPNGMPKEPYGISGNAVSYGPPAWSDAKFEVKEKDISFKIKM